MLVGVQVDLAGSKGCIRGDIVTEGLEVHLEPVFFCFLCDELHDLFRIAGSDADGDLFLVSRCFGFFLLVAAAGDSACSDEGCEGQCDCFCQFHSEFLLDRKCGAIKKSRSLKGTRYFVLPPNFMSESLRDTL